MSASHMEGRRFEPGRKLSVYLTFVVFGYLDLVMNCFTSLILRVMKIFSRNSKTCARQTRTQNLHFSFKNVCSSIPSSKTFFKTTERSWTKTILSTGGRRKLFYSSLMNKLIQEQKLKKIMFECKMTNRKYRLFVHERKQKYITIIP